MNNLAPSLAATETGAKSARAICRHCGSGFQSEFQGAGDFCCGGCAAAFELVRSLGLSRYYDQKVCDPAQRPNRPDAQSEALNLAAWIKPLGEDRSQLTLMVDGLQCGACVWLIEQTLLRQPGVAAARVALSTRRLTMVWRNGQADPVALVELITRLGYRLIPCDPERLAAATASETKELLKCMAVAGFAAGNIMLLSVSVWSGAVSEMSVGTRDLLHWISAMIAIPAVAYAGRPFFRSAWSALRNRRSNMDVPISIAVILAPGVSLVETFTSGAHAYFDSAVTLLFFLLIGRFLDQRARHRAHEAATRLLALNAVAATVIEADGTRRDLPPSRLTPGMIVLVAPGGRVPADGRIVVGSSDLDLSLISGESAPQGCEPGDAAFAGTLNLTGSLQVLVTAVGEATLLSDIIRLMEAAESRRGRYLRLADRVARLYAPVVHSVALLTFLGWTLLGGMAWSQALLISIAILIITCPCALALAVPVVQVVASQRLMRAGILLKSNDALERLCQIDHVVFDKTGTLTLGRLTLQPGAEPRLLAIAAGMAANSRHPLARALTRAAPGAPILAPVIEHPGRGLEWRSPEGMWRLGSCAFTGQPEDSIDDQVLWLVGPSTVSSGECQRFVFSDQLRPDAKEVVANLARRRLGLEICSGDRQAPVAAMAESLRIRRWSARLSPVDKVKRLQALAEMGHRVLMVGDGINDAAALAAAHVSIAPAGGAEISQNTADIVFQGDRLGAIPLALKIATSAGRLMRQNLAIALVYNLAAVPLAIGGYVTPLVAAAAMSSSSVIVILNALRLGRVSAK
jgi:P-type Cu2+ transporter